MGVLNPNRLLVEGEEDKRVIPYFMDHFLKWGDEKDEWPVEIKALGGIEDLLQPGVIETALKTRDLKALGVIVDGNDDPMGRWKRIRERALKAFSDLPNDMPEEGLLAMNTEGLKFGAWLMPDNRKHGMLETFLRLFVPADGEPLWSFVEGACVEAKKHGASYKDAHIDKVRIHAWLALQDPPGQSLHLAVLAKTLNPSSPCADKFVSWFRSLYGI